MLQEEHTLGHLEEGEAVFHPVQGDAFYRSGADTDGEFVSCRMDGMAEGGDAGGI